MCGERGRIPRRASWKFACGGLKEAEVRSELEERTALALERKPKTSCDEELAGRCN